MLAVTGIRSRIVEELRQMLPEGEEVAQIDGRGYLYPNAEIGAALICNRYLMCAGVLRPVRLRDQQPYDIEESLLVNCIRPMQMCDAILERNPDARIVVMGSESGFSWSYDGAYAAAKAALHRYVETKTLKPNQQLVCVAPSIIEDCSMTLRREDTDNLERRRLANPKHRFLKAVEVARMIHFLLYVDQGYTTGTVIRMNGGGR